MVQVTAPIQAIVARYCRELRLLGVNVSQVFLFGSHARGTTHEWSDIDLIVVSADFAPMGLRERLETLGVAAGRILEPIQAYGVTPEAVEKGQLSPFWANVMEQEAIPVDV